jgi:hypothetical protein
MSFQNLPRTVLKNPGKLSTTAVFIDPLMWPQAVFENPFVAALAAYSKISRN